LPFEPRWSLRSSPRHEPPARSGARRVLARSGRFVSAVYICFGKYYETPFLHTIEAHS